MKFKNLHNTILTDERQQRINKVLNHRQNDLTLVLENVNDPHNIAAVLRTCDAVGIMEIFVINTTQNTFKHFDDRKSSSANKWLLVHQFTDMPACFEAVKKKYQHIYSTYLGNESKDLFELDLCQSTALVFGNERVGVSKEALSYCDGNFNIPQVGIIKSLNISVACAITIYEAFRQKRLQGHYKAKKVNRTDETELLNHWHLQTDEPTEE